MTQAILDPDGIRLQPFLDHRRVDIVVVAPAFVAGVVGRVDGDAVHPAGIERQERLQGMQVVTLNNQVAVDRDRADALLRARHEWAEGHG